MSNLIIPNDLIREGYSIMETLFEDLLENPSELYVNENPLDIVSILLEKIDIVKKEYNLDYDIFNELCYLENEVYTKILDAFNKEFLEDGEKVEDLVESLSTRVLAMFIYNTFYLNRRSNILEYLVESTLNKRKSLVKQFKTPDTRWDLTYYAIRSGLKLNDNDYYVVLMFSNDIFDTFIGDEDVNINEYLLYSDIDEQFEEIISELFQYNGNLVFNRLKTSLKNYSGYSQIRSIYKDLLLTRINSNPNLKSSTIEE